MGTSPRPGVYAMPRGHILDLRWNALLSEFRRSGLTQAEFCQRRGISIYSFRKRLYGACPSKPASAAQCPPAERPSPFLPVTILPDLTSVRAATHALELVVSNG